MGTNNCVIEGRLTKDAEYSVFGQNATPKLSFGFANNTGYGDYKKTNFFNCEIIGKKAESLAQYMLKGKACNLIGEMQQNKWEDNDGNKHNRWVLHVLNTSFTSGSKNDTQESGSTQREVSNSSPASHQRPSQTSKPPTDPFAAALASSQPEADNEDEFYNPDQNKKFQDDDVPW